MYKQQGRASAGMGALGAVLSQVKAAFSAGNHRLGIFGLAAALLATPSAQAAVTPTQVTTAPDIGIGQEVDVSINWTRTGGAGDTISIVIPAQLQVDPPAPPANCTYSAPNMTCTAPAGSSGILVFPVRGAIAGGFNLSATGTSGPAAAFSGQVRNAGDLTVAKSMTSPASGNPLAGGLVTFQLAPEIATGGNEVPVGGSITLTDTLPGNASTGFVLEEIAFSGPLTPSCNTVANANSTRTLTCVYSAGGSAISAAQLNASRINVTGRTESHGSFVNTAQISSGNTLYIDLNAGNNTASLPYNTDPATDLAVAITSTISNSSASPSPGLSSRTITLTVNNNGPMTSAAGAVVETVVPAGFTLGTLPAGCTAAAGSLTISPPVGGDTQTGSWSGTRVTCTAGALNEGQNAQFVLPITLDNVGRDGLYLPAVVTPPAGQDDGRPENNSATRRYWMAPSAADLGMGKSKSPAKVAAGGTVTTTLRVTNHGPETVTWDADHRLRVVDWLDPREIAGGVIGAPTGGWSCTVTPNSPRAGYPDLTTQVSCEHFGPGAMAVDQYREFSFTHTVVDAATLGPDPVALQNLACTGSEVLRLLELDENDGPQPADPADSAASGGIGESGLVGQDCRGVTGQGTTILAGEARVGIVKESSVDGTNWYDNVADAPTLAAADNDLHWRMTITTASVAQNPAQKIIPNLQVKDIYRGLMRAAGTPGYVTPNITFGYDTSGAPGVTHSCPASISGNPQNHGHGNGVVETGGTYEQVCNFNNVPPGSTIVVTATLTRPLGVTNANGWLDNEATLDSSNAFLEDLSGGGNLSDSARVVVERRADVALTSKTVATSIPASGGNNPMASVGETVMFTITARNQGQDHIAAGNFRITDSLFTGTPSPTVPAFEVLGVDAADPAKMSCAASNLASGSISCVNTGVISRHEVQTITVRARVKRPASYAGVLGDKLYENVTNTAYVHLDNMCEYRVDGVADSATCGDANALANNTASAVFDVTVPSFDLQQGKVPLFPAGQSEFRAGDDLRYRFSIRNAGPSIAESVVMTDRLTVPAGFTLVLQAPAPGNLNAAPASSGYTLANKTIACSQAAPSAEAVCTFDTLDVNEEVNFELVFRPVGVADTTVIFGNAVNVCADETNSYESSGKCDADPAQAGNNLAAINNVLFPSTDLEVVSKTATVSPVDVGQPVPWQIVLRNNGISTSTQMRLVDTLPAGFEWVGTTAPGVGNPTGGATLSAGGGNLTVLAGPPASPDAANVCYVSNGIANVTGPAQQQEVTCHIDGNFPANSGFTLTLHARPKAGVYTGPYLSNVNNHATVSPGKDADGEDLAKDSDPDNNDGDGPVQVRNASIGGRVFLDRNNNGDQDGTGAPQDAGLNGVSLTLTGIDLYGNTVNLTVTTDAQGDYSFGNLAPSNADGYTITQDQGTVPAAYNNGVPQPNTPRSNRNGTSTGVTPAAGGYTVNNTPGSSVIGGIVLGSGGQGVQFDFPETDLLSLSGYVFADNEPDDVYVPGVTDTPIAGATLELLILQGGVYVPVGGPSATAVTGSDGFYEFSGLVGGETYAVRQLLPTGYANKPSAVRPGRIGGSPCTVCSVATGVSGDAATTDRISGIVLSANGTDFNFGEMARNSSIGGKVWIDRNNDGVVDPDETGLPGVDVTLTGTDSAGNVLPPVTVTTDADGNYTFDNLPPGNYTVTEPTQPAGTNNGQTVPGTTGGTGTPVTTTPSAITGIALGVNEHSTGNNFGEIPPGVISGRVYNDGNDNGVVDNGEGGIANVTVELTGTDDLGQPVSMTTTTDADGRYRFEGLRPGTYTVTEPTQPPETLNGITTPGTINGTPVGVATDKDTTPSAISQIVLPLGGSSIDNNFGEIGDSPDMLVSKSSTTVKFTVNNPATYVIRVRNGGQQPSAGEYVVHDRLPTGLSLAAPPAGNGWTCGGAVGDTRFECRSSDVIGAGATSTSEITVTVNVSAAAAEAGTVNNAVLVEGGGENPFRTPTPEERAAFDGDVEDLPPCEDDITRNACRVPNEVQLSASVGGTVWFDIGSEDSLLDGGDERLPSWIVELVDPASGEVVKTTTTAADGSYRFGDVVPGVEWNIRFRDPASGTLWAWPVNRENAAGTGVSCDATAAIANGEASACRTTDGGVSQLQVVLKPGAHLPQQSLPVDPSGVVYDSSTRDPVPGAVVTLVPVGACNGYDPLTAVLNAGGGGYTVEGNAISMTVGSNGYYQFVFGPGAPDRCEFRLTVTPPGGYQFVSQVIPPQDGSLSPPGGPGSSHPVQPQATAPTGAVGTETRYWLTLFSGSATGGIIHNHLPLDAAVAPGLVITKTGDRRIAEIGDTVQYTITIRQTAGNPLQTVNVVDTLPRGFTYIEGTARAGGVAVAEPLGKPGPQLGFDVGPLSTGGQIVLTYRVRIGVGAQQGDGVNRAQAHGCSIAGGCIDPVSLTPLPGSVPSNRAEYRVRVTGGVFAEEACVLGKVFVDCNNNHVQDAEELGIPGVRLYFSNGTWVISDSEGKYSYCGLPPQSHTLKVDPSTLPAGSRLTTSSNRNLGDADSLFLDLKNGELHRADFIEGSCSNPVIEQVKARRTQGEVRAPETETGQSQLRFESKPLRAPQQATDSANQRPIVEPRPNPPSASAAQEVQP